MPKICLNMIIKNESKIITRLLDSVSNIIDYYCICDTGSTDNSVEIITEYFKEKNIPGEVIFEEFRDFGYNRTYALNACRKFTQCDYVLLMDADMVLEGSALDSPESFKAGLTMDAYHLFQGNASFHYKNTRIVRNREGFSYWGVTHEYLNNPPDSVVETLDYDYLRIHDVGDGGAKTDKFERDIRLLKQGLLEIPNNDRYTFYLANSYKDAGQPENAIETYRKRIEIGGWADEVWNSYYCIGLCYMSLNKPMEAVNSWLDALQVCDRRIENLYEIVKYYREQGKNSLAYSFYVMADEIRKKYPANPNFLFLHKDVYDFKLDYELSIVGFYSNYKNYNIIYVCMKVLQHSNDGNIIQNVLSNFKFYVENICKYDILPVQFKNVFESIIVKDESGELVSSTPSLYLSNKDLLVNVRYVNYRIDENGNYINKDKVTTVNRLSVIDIHRKKVKSTRMLDYDTKLDNYYVGIEDVRLFETNSGKLMYNGNRGLEQGIMAIELGKIHEDKKIEYELLSIDDQRQIEKNWVVIPNKSQKNELTMIYNWSPLRIGTIEGNQFNTTHLFENVPSFFYHLRGSTNGIRIQDEIWLICHTVSYEDRRNYYHIIVVLDANTYELKKYSPYFTFEGGKVEYTLGMVYLKITHELLIGYSVYDNTTKFMKISKNYFEERFIIP